MQNLEDKLSPPSQNLGNHIKLNDVQQSLKAIQQKRLSRLNMCTDMSQENRCTDLSIQSVNTSIVKEDTSVNKLDAIETTFTKINQDNKGLSKRRFLAKFNCVGVQSEILSPNKTISEEQESSGSDSKVQYENETSVNHPSRENILDRTSTPHVVSSSVDELDNNENKINTDKLMQTKTHPSFDDLQANNQLNKAVTYSNVNTKISVQKPHHNCPTDPQLLTEDLTEKNEELLPRNDSIGPSENQQSKILVNNIKNYKTQISSNSFKLSQNEKVVKKFQINCVAVKKILENISSSSSECEIDKDEMEDFMKTLNETKTVLLDYENNVNKLAIKLSFRKVEEIRKDLKDVYFFINHFRGLRRDSSFTLLCERLNTFEGEIQNITTKEKQELLEYLGCCNKLLNNKVKRNEERLFIIFNEIIDNIKISYINETYL